jgi:hypothetical protein
MINSVYDNELVSEKDKHRIQVLCLVQDQEGSMKKRED